MVVGRWRPRERSWLAGEDAGADDDTAGTVPPMDRMLAVVRYIEVLAASLDTTTFAADRAVYERHLAAAARLVALVVRSGDQREVDAWLRSEERGFGWGYLSGGQGEQAESAFVELSAALASR